MIKRDRSYRRKQEARKYMKRLKFCIKLDYFKEKDCSSLEDYKKIRWAKSLKNGDVVYGWIGSYGKRLSRRTRRHYQRLVTWRLPDKVFLKRKHIGHEGNQELYDEMRRMWIL